MRKNRVEISYNANSKNWEIIDVDGGVKISNYSFAENDGLGFIAHLTHCLLTMRASTKDDVICEENPETSIDLIEVIDLAAHFKETPDKCRGCNVRFYVNGKHYCLNENKNNCSVLNKEANNG